MRKDVNPAVIIGTVIVAVLVIGLLGWKLMSAMTSEPQATVKAANPDDPKFRSDPRIGVASGGGGTNAPAGNTND